MALKSSTTCRGIPVPDAYHRVVHVANSRMRNDSMIIVEVLAEPNAQEPFETRTFVAPYDKDLTVSAAYNYLKTLPEFAGAVDV